MVFTTKSIPFGINHYYLSDIRTHRQFVVLCECETHWKENRRHEHWENEPISYERKTAKQTNSTENDRWKIGCCVLHSSYRFVI